MSPIINILQLNSIAARAPGKLTHLAVWQIAVHLRPSKLGPIFCHQSNEGEHIGSSFEAVMEQNLGN